MDELLAKTRNLREEISQAVKKLRLGELEAELTDLRQRMQRPDFWQDIAQAQETSKQEAALARRIQPWLDLQDEMNETLELIELKDTSLESELKSRVLSLESRVSELKSDLRFNGPYDDHDVILGIHAGAGGTDAQDWAQMLERMYLRWAEGQGLKAKIADESPGEEAGIKSATIEISGGGYLYGKLAGEHGVHRLVRLSPFNSAASRETSFAKVEVLPMIDRPDEVELDDKDLKIDVYRAGGHGGQSVNTTDSAVRVTHLPSGITVAIQNERSQLQNKETALAILRSKLIQLQMEQHAETLAEVKGPSQAAEFGSQIRNYVLHPYKQVKDLRSGYESSDVEKVLNGQLDGLINAWLENKHQ